MNKKKIFKNLFKPLFPQINPSIKLNSPQIKKSFLHPKYLTRLHNTFILRSKQVFALDQELNDRIAFVENRLNKLSSGKVVNVPVVVDSVVFL